MLVESYKQLKSIAIYKPHTIMSQCMTFEHVKPIRLCLRQHGSPGSEKNVRGSIREEEKTRRKNEGGNSKGRSKEYRRGRCIESWVDRTLKTSQKNRKNLKKRTGKRRDRQKVGMN